MSRWISYRRGHDLRFVGAGSAADQTSIARVLRENMEGGESAHPGEDFGTGQLDLDSLEQPPDADRKLARQRSKLAGAHTNAAVAQGVDEVVQMRQPIPGER